MMGIRLYHLTSRENAKEILESGFIDGEDGGVWFAEHPKLAWGATYEVVALKVTFHCLKSKLACYAIECGEESGEWDSEKNCWVPVQEEFIQRFTCYLIPAVFIKENATVSLLSDKRYLSLMR